MAEPAGACPADDELAAMAGGAVGGDQRARLERHLDRCAACAHLLRELGALLAPGEPDPVLPPRYRLVRALGHGAMGMVYEAEDRTLGRRVAIKRLRPDVADTDERDRLRARLVREARLLAALQHPNVIGVLDAEVVGDDVFIALELARGQDAAAWVVAARPRWPQIVDVYRGAGAGLAAAHDAGLVHRDVKPANILVAGARVWITDFGLATVELAGDTLAVELTAAGAVVGTPAFMAPEQLRGERADARSDQFAFCASLWHALHGRVPYPGATLAAIAMAHGRGRPSLPPAVRTPRAVRRVLERGLASEPGARYPSMAALLAALDRARRGGRARALLAAVLGAAMVVAGWRALRTEADPPPGRASRAAASASRDAEPVSAAATPIPHDAAADEPTAPGSIATATPTADRTAPPIDAASPRIRDERVAPPTAHIIVDDDARKHHRAIDAATSAISDLDAATCRAQLAIADRLRRTSRDEAVRQDTEADLLHVMCDMVDGACGDGVERLEAIHARRGATPEHARTLALVSDALLCAPDAGPLDRRLARVQAQADPQGGRGPERCRRVLRTGLATVEAGFTAGHRRDAWLALQRLADCAAALGNCAQAQGLWARADAEPGMPPARRRDCAPAP